MKRNLIIMTLLLANASFAQTELKFGDTLPIVPLTHIINKNTKGLNTADLYKRGGLIINFWATWCKPCIREQAFMDSLLKKANPGISVLSVTYEDSSTVKRHYETRGMLTAAGLYIGNNEKLFHKIFPHKVIPHNIWIDNKGVIRAITGADEITEKNIRDFATGKPTKLYTKTDDLSFDFRKPYHVEDSLISYRSLFAGFNPNITSGLTYGSENGYAKRIFLWNRPTVHMYWMAHVRQLNSRINWSLVELHTSDSARFYQPGLFKEFFKRTRYNDGTSYHDMARKWNQDNIYCYELQLPEKETIEKFSEYMFNDLERYFKIRASVKLKKMGVTLVSLKNKEVAFPDTATKSNFTAAKNMLFINNKTVQEILDYIYQNYGGDIPYVDETGVKGKVSLKVEVYPREKNATAEDLWKGLEKHGFIRKPGKRPYPILILNDLIHPPK